MNGNDIQDAPNSLSADVKCFANASGESSEACSNAVWLGSPTNWRGLQTDFLEPFHLSIYAEKVDIFYNRLKTAISIS